MYWPIQHREYSQHADVIAEKGEDTVSIEQFVATRTLFVFEISDQTMISRAAPCPRKFAGLALAPYAPAQNIATRSPTSARGRCA